MTDPFGLPSTPRLSTRKSRQPGHDQSVKAGQPHGQLIPSTDIVVVAEIMGHERLAMTANGSS